MQHDIIDNLNIKLVDVLKEKLSISKRARFGVGWLFISGFKELREEIDKLEKLEILAGSKTNKQTAEIMLLEKKWEEAVRDSLEKTKFLPEDKRQEILDEEFKSLMNDLSYIKPTEENIEFLKWLLEKLREGKIVIRIYYKEPFHAKLYLFEYKDQRHGKGEAIVGSSNFSLSGFDLNTELNVRLLGDENFQFLSEWFENLWQESEKADFTFSAMKAIEKSWAFNQEVTPFRIYLKVLHEIFSYKDPDPMIETEADLYRYQRDAVIDAYKKLQIYNGVFVSDVPGVGKTYIGSALLSHLETEGKPAIVIVPPRLIDQWKEVLADLGVAKAQVFSSGKLEEILENENLLRRKVILVDESHHFRNPDTRKYKDLQKICQDKQVILISATPQNLSIWDLYWQIKLFTSYEANHNFRLYPIELKKYFDACEKGNANIEDLIGQIFIRRTRGDIKKYYPEEQIFFPNRKGPFRIDYSIDEIYEGGLYQRLRGLINRLTYARYNLGKYAKPEKFDPDEFRRLSVAWQNLQRFVKINIYRRLESSVQAFRDTINNQLKIYKGFLEILEEKHEIFIGDINEIEELTESIESGGDIELNEGEDYYSEDKFDSKSIKEDLLNDIKIFEDIFNSVKEIKPEDDDKLQKLIEVLNSSEIKDKKIIIFSSFESTVRYIYENLKERFKQVDYACGGEKILHKIKRFAPKANKVKINPNEEINILVATEILSEGLNLQDGQVVMNYELHWNPVRIIQRIGRIDRIGSKYDEIYVYNFFPETEAEKEIKVETKVNNRIKDIIENFGGDEKVIGMDDPVKIKKLFEIYTEKPEGLEEIEEESSSKYFEFEFRKLTGQYLEEYEKAKQLPSMVHCAKKYKENALVVFCRSEDYFRLRLLNEKGEIISKDDWTILQMIKSDIDEPALVFNTKLFPFLEIAREDFEKESNQREKDKAFTINPIKKEFERLIKWFQRKESKDIKARFDKLIDFVDSKQLSYDQEKMIRNITRSYKKKFGLKKIEILNELEEKIDPLLEKTSDIAIPEIKPKYAQIIVAEELK